MPIDRIPATRNEDKHRYFSFLQRTGSIGTGFSNALPLQDWTQLHAIFAFDLTERIERQERSENERKSRMERD